MASHTPDSVLRTDGQTPTLLDAGKCKTAQTGELGPSQHNGTIPIHPKLWGTCGKVECDRDISVLWIPTCPKKEWFGLLKGY